MKKKSMSIAATLAMAGGLAVAPMVLVPAVAAEEPAVATATEDSGEQGSKFLLTVLPDTQFYSRYSADQFYPRYQTNPFEVQTQWIVDNQDDLNIPFTIHVGDVVDRVGVNAEWDAADKAMAILEGGGANYSILPGNHDVTDQDARSSEGISGNYLSRFSTERISQQETYVASYQNGVNSAYIFEAEGQKFMSLALAWNASDDAIDWAQSVIDDNPEVPVILSSHAIVNVAGDGVSPADHWYGELLWERLISPNDQIFMTVNGHFHGATQRTRVNDAGNEVYQVLTDYQMAADGGNGYMTVMEFDLEKGDIDVETISPWVPLKHEETRTVDDRPYLSGTWQSFTLDANLKERFSGFAPDFGPGPGAYGDLSEQAKEMVAEGWDGDDSTDPVAAGSREDYQKVPGTVAHWRFGDLPEGVVTPEMSISDVTGNNPMHRLEQSQMNAQSEPEDMVIVKDDLPFASSDGAAVCFSGATRSNGRASYLTTEYETPVTKKTFPEGYTIESWVKLDESWTADDNAWAAWLTRTGRRSTLDMPWQRYDFEQGPAFLSVSNLREFQWGVVPENGQLGPNSLWSGEIMTDTWYHVAVVNDPVENTTIMYVNGVPVLRNAVNLNGMSANIGYPWAIGSNWNYDEANNGWNGCVGETRIVERPLAPAQFLFNRVDIDGDAFSFTDAPEGDQPAGTVVTSLAGTGVAGAEAVVSVGSDQAPQRVKIAEDGTWSVTLDNPISAAGAHTITVTQALGERAGKVLTANFTIAGADNGGVTPTPPDPDGSDNGGNRPTPGAPDGTDKEGAGKDGSDKQGGAGVGDSSAQPSSGLAATGASVSIIAVLVIVALAGIGGVLVYLRRRRS